MTDSIEVIGLCGRPLCHRTYAIRIGRGRPRLYCSDECRRAADNERKRTVARIEHLEEQLRRERHYLAAFGTEDPRTETAGPRCTCANPAWDPDPECPIDGMAAVAALSIPPGEGNLS